MEFENLQAIWDTQNEKPVFAIHDARLLLALYQHREHSRRKLFIQQFAPMYATLLIGLAGLGFIFYAFFWKSLYIERLGRDFPMSAWDYAAFAAAAVALACAVAPMHAQRKRHELRQKVFAPSLREELEQGISQLNFELRLYSAPQLAARSAWLAVAVLLFNGEVGRLNGNVAPWDTVWMGLLCMATATWVSLLTTKSTIRKVIERRRSLESMLAALEENS